MPPMTPPAIAPALDPPVLSAGGGAVVLAEGVAAFVGVVLLG